MSSGIVWLNQQEGKLLRVIRYHLMMFLPRSMTGGVDAPGCLLKFPFVYLVKQSFDPFDEPRLRRWMGRP